MLIAVFFKFALFAVLFLFFIPTNSIQGSSALLIENVVALSNPKQESAGLPMRLKIPEIGVDSAVISVGLTSDGAMDVPKSPTKVAWFSLGSRPGEDGSAVIAGHYDWKNNMPAVFNNLYKLDVGDKILVEDEKGVTMIFIVREIKTYNKDDEAPDVFGSNDEKAHLNLITCTGAWSKKFNQYSERLVVFSERK